MAWHGIMTAPTLPSYVLLLAVHLGCTVTTTTAGGKHCDGYMECVIFTGYTCKNNKCVCEPDPETGTYRCTPPRSYGERCRTDQECMPSDSNLYCLKTETRLCRCKRGYIWDSVNKKCFAIDDDMYSGKFDAVRDLIIPAIIIMTIGAMVYLGIKLFCNCGKMCRRRRHQDITRELEEMSVTPHQQAAWIASYRVFSPYNSATRNATGLSPNSFPMHPAPCMGLFVPSQSLSTSPPPYEEALKHKVILSSYHAPPGPMVPPYTLPTLPVPDVSRQYHTLPGPSTLLINPSRVPTVAGPRSLPEPEVWTQLQYSGTTAPGWVEEVAKGGESTRSGTVEVWTPQGAVARVGAAPPTSSFRPGQPQRTYTSGDNIHTTLT